MGDESITDFTLQRVQLVIRPKYGTISQEDRRAIVDALRRTMIGQVRIDEAIVLNLGIGGAARLADHDGRLREHP